MIYYFTHYKISRPYKGVQRFEPLPTKTYLQQSTNAFTLIELLIVLLIIGIVTASASLMLSNTNREQKDLKTAINLLKDRAILAQQEAVLSTSTIGITISSQGYQFFRYVEVLPSHTWNWQALQNTALKYQTWPKGTVVTLQTNQQQAILLGDALPTQPQIIFYPSNQLTPFQLSANNKYEIIGTKNGRIIARLARA